MDNVSGKNWRKLLRKVDWMDSAFHRTQNSFTRGSTSSRCRERASIWPRLSNFLSFHNFIIHYHVIILKIVSFLRRVMMITLTVSLVEFIYYIYLFLLSKEVNKWSKENKIMAFLAMASYLYCKRQPSRPLLVGRTGRWNKLLHPLEKHFISFFCRYQPPYTRLHSNWMKNRRLKLSQLAG